MGIKKVILFELCHLCGHIEKRVMKFVAMFDSENDLWEFVGYTYSDEEQKNLFFMEATRAIGIGLRGNMIEEKGESTTTCASVSEIPYTTPSRLERLSNINAALKKLLIKTLRTLRLKKIFKI